MSAFEWKPAYAVGDEHINDAPRELSTFLKVWLTRHIIGADKKYGPYIHNAEPEGAGTG